MDTSTPYRFLIGNGKMRCRHRSVATDVPVTLTGISGDAGLSHINKDAPFYDYVITKTKKTTVKRKKITITHTPKDNNIDRNNKSITRTKTT